MHSWDTASDPGRFHKASESAAPGLQDAAKPFGFPDTLTAASYVLRRAYAQLLWDFEQVQPRRS